MSRFDAALEAGKSGAIRAHVAALPAAVRERLAARNLEGSVRIAFEEPVAAGTEMVSRGHPLPATLAEMLLEGALDPTPGSVPSLGRAGCWPSTAVKTVTTVATLRLRYKLVVRARGEGMLLAEEAATVAWDAAGAMLPTDVIQAFLDQPASTDLAPTARQRLLSKAVDQATSMLGGPIATFAIERAKALAEDHGRVRAAASGSARVTVEPVLPADVIGLYVLAPAGH
jgi:hypothetical protein